MGREGKGRGKKKGRRSTGALTYSIMGLNCGETALLAQTDGPLGVANHTLEGQGTALTGRVT